MVLQGFESPACAAYARHGVPATRAMYPFWPPGAASNPSCLPPLAPHSLPTHIPHAPSSLATPPPALPVRQVGKMFREAQAAQKKKKEEERRLEEQQQAAAELLVRVCGTTQGCACQHTLPCPAIRRALGLLPDLLLLPAKRGQPTWRPRP